MTNCFLEQLCKKLYKKWEKKGTFPQVLHPSLIHWELPRFSLQFSRTYPPRLHCRVVHRLQHGDLTAVESMWDGGSDVQDWMQRKNCFAGRVWTVWTLLRLCFTFFQLKKKTIQQNRQNAIENEGVLLTSPRTYSSRGKVSAAKNPQKIAWRSLIYYWTYLEHKCWIGQAIYRVPQLHQTRPWPRASRKRNSRWSWEEVPALYTMASYSVSGKVSPCEGAQRDYKIFIILAVVLYSISDPMMSSTELTDCLCTVEDLSSYGNKCPDIHHWKGNFDWSKVRIIALAMWRGVSAEFWPLTMDSRRSCDRWTHSCL